MPAPLTRWLGATSADLRAGIRYDKGRAMRLRRAAAATALVGIASMILDALTHFAILALILPEAAGAVRHALAHAAA